MHRDQQNPIALSEDLKSFLQEELLRRCKRNPKYSLRSFAKFLDLDPSLLSKIIHGHRRPSLSVAKKVSDAFGWGPEWLAGYKSAESDAASYSKTDFQLMPHEVLKLVTDWYHHAILELTELRDFSPSFEWISKTLGIGESTVGQAVERLKRAGLLEITWDKRGKAIWKAKFKRIVNGSMDVESFRTHQEQVISLALGAVRTVPVDLKCQMSSLIAIDSGKVLGAKRKIFRYLDGFNSSLQSRSKIKDDVYLVSFSMVPITTLKKGLPENFSETEKILNPCKKTNTK